MLPRRAAEKQPVLRARSAAAVAAVAARLVFPGLVVAGLVLGWPAVVRPAPTMEIQTTLRQPDPAIVAAVEGHVVPLVAAFAGETERLSRSVARICANPTAVSAAAFLRSMERTVRLGGAVAVLRFAPAVADREIERIVLPPARFDTVEAVLAGTRTMPDTVDALHRDHRTLQGLPVLEAVLYQHARRLSAEIEPRRCRLGRLVATHISILAGDLHADLGPGEPYRSALVNPGPDNPMYPSVGSVHADVVRMVHGGIVSLGVELQGLVEGREADARVRRSFRAATLQLAYVRGKSRGLLGSIGPQTFGRVLGERAEAPVATLRDHLSAVVTAIESIEATDGVEPRERRVATAASARVALAQAVVEGPLAASVDVSLEPGRR